MKEKAEAIYFGMLLYTTMLDTNTTSGRYTWNLPCMNKDIRPAHIKVRFLLPVHRVLMVKSPLLLYMYISTYVMIKTSSRLHDSIPAHTYVIT